MSNIPSYKELYESRHEPENLRPLAEVYWRAILLVEVFVLALALALVVWAYSVVHSHIETANKEGQTQVAPINTEVIGKALELVEKRQSLFGASPSESNASTGDSR